MSETKYKSKVGYQPPIELKYDGYFPSFSAIEQFARDQQKKIDECVLQGCIKVGVNVDKDELVKALEYDRGQYMKGYNDGYYDGGRDAIRRGEWVGVSPMVDTRQCSRCGYNIISEELETPYCPYCGAKMTEAQG